MEGNKGQKQREKERKEKRQRKKERREREGGNRQLLTPISSVSMVGVR